MIDKVYYVRCDECLDRPQEPAATPKEARTIAEQASYARVGKRDLCPSCFARETGPKVTPRKTITAAALARLATCNSKRLPKLVQIDGHRKRWVGIGWVDEGLAHGDEVLVVESGK